MTDVDTATEVNTPPRRLTPQMLGNALGIPFTPPPLPTPVAEDEPDQYERLAPGTVMDMIGQEAVRLQMLSLLTAAQRHNRSPGHMLLSGPMGLGKTTLARMVSTFMGVRLVETDAVALDKPTQLFRILADLRPGDVLFIDEIHRLNRKVTEALYKAMTEFKMNVPIGRGANASVEEVKINRFVLVAATTQTGEMLAPLKQRFKFVGEMCYYTDDQLSDIVIAASGKYDMPFVLDEYAALAIAMRSRGTPRIALTMMEQARDVAITMLEPEADGSWPTAIVDLDVVDTTFAIFDVDSEGLTPNDRAVLLEMVAQGGGPVGIEHIAAITGIDKATVRNTVEPWLIRAGFMRRGPSGRVLMPKAYEHLRASYPNIPNVPFHIRHQGLS